MHIISMLCNFRFVQGLRSTKSPATEMTIICGNEYIKNICRVLHLQHACLLLSIETLQVKP